MTKVLRVLFAGLLVMMLAGVACKRSSVTSNVPPQTTPAPLATPTDADPVLKLASEIELQRIYSGCSNCDDHSLLLSRKADDIFADAAVVRNEFHTKKQRTGTLSAYYYNHLLQLVDSEDVFAMDNEYATGWIDSLIVTLNVTIGNRHKTIRTSSEGHVPLKVWGFYMAIDGAAAHIKWDDVK